MMIKRHLSILGLFSLILCLFLSGCLSRKFPVMSGLWDLEMISEEYTGNSYFEITRHYGYNFSGLFCEGGRPCRELFGLLFDGGKVSIYTWIDGKSIDFNGEISKDNMSGTFIIHSTQEEGTWTASKQ